MTTDEEAEACLDQDLSDLDFAQFKAVRFNFEPVKRDEPQDIPKNAPEPE